ncbi:hypothetical protein FKM82_014465 [Ascaphus truei]
MRTRRGERTVDPPTGIQEQAGTSAHVDISIMESVSGDQRIDENRKRRDIPFSKPPPLSFPPSFFRSCPVVFPSICLLNVVCPEWILPPLLWQ